MCRKLKLRDLAVTLAADMTRAFTCEPSVEGWMDGMLESGSESLMDLQLL